MEKIENNWEGGGGMKYLYKIEKKWSSPKTLNIVNKDYEKRVGAVFCKYVEHLNFVRQGVNSRLVLGYKYRMQGHC